MSCTNRLGSGPGLFGLSTKCRSFPSRSQKVSIASRATAGLIGTCCLLSPSIAEEGVDGGGMKCESAAVVGVGEGTSMLVHDGIRVASIDCLAKIANAEVSCNRVFAGTLAGLGVGVCDREGRFVDEGARIVLLDWFTVLSFAKVADRGKSCLAVLIIPFHSSPRIGWVAVLFQVGFGVDHVAVGSTALFQSATAVDSMRIILT